MARHQGQVVFVRHAVPGERVVALVTDVGRKGRFLRATTVEVVEASPHRVTAPCPYATSCGGCDWQHVDLAHQRDLKSAVVKEQLQRLAGIDWDVLVEPVPGDVDGLGWRTRVRYAVDDDGRAGFRRHRSHDVVAVDRCLLAHRLVEATGATRRSWVAGTEVEVSCVPATGQTVVRGGGTEPDPGGKVVVELAAGRRWQVSGGFWQVHRGAAELLVDVVRDLLTPRLGEHVLDLYAGVGLFAGALGEQVAAGGRVDAVEADSVACDDASANLADLPWAAVHRAPVTQYLRRAGLRRVDLVVLDPPRSGAGREVSERVAALRPRAVGYVACDPAALARDLRTFADLGYRLQQLRAFDLFPMTSHVEVVAKLVRNDSDLG